MKKMNKLEGKYERKYPFLYIQWHITAVCQYRCKHCYLPSDETYRNEINYELDFQKSLSLIDEIFLLAEKENTELLDICLTGGDPLLRKDLFDLIDYIQDKEKNSSIRLDLSLMSTPKSINKRNLTKLKKRSLKNIQLSIDGRENIHDSIRGKGAFKELLKALDLLKKEDCPLLLMFTLSRENKDELIPLMNWAGEKEIDSLAFSRVVPLGDALKNYDEESFFSPEEYREFLIAILRAQYENAKKDKKTYFPLKEPLWQLLYKEHNRWEEDKVSGCCYVGGMLTVLADGTLLPCRRLPLSLGRFPDVSLIDTFYNSPLLNNLRDLSKYEKCSTCQLVKTCRGNPCVSYGLTGNPYSPDPQCWRDD